MIQVTDINPLTLPSLLLEDRWLLPRVAAVYIVLESDRVIYIGQSNNLLQRWRSHQQWHQLKDRGKEIRIAWVECSERQLLASIEKALIQVFEPELNDWKPVASKLEAGKNVANYPKIKELREKRGLSQRRLAQALDLTENTIANWENGRTGLDWFERVAKLCDALECSPVLPFSQLAIVFSVRSNA